MTPRTDRCAWQHHGDHWGCSEPATVVLWDPTHPEPIGYHDGNPLGWSVDNRPKPDDYIEPVEGFCKAHAQMVLDSMISEARNYLFTQLAKTERRIKSRISSAFHFGSLTSGEEQELHVLLTRHSALVHELTALLNKEVRTHGTD